MAFNSLIALDLMLYLTTFCGSQIRKGYEKGIATIEFISTIIDT